MDELNNGTNIEETIEQITNGDTINEETIETADPDVTVRCCCIKENNITFDRCVDIKDVTLPESGEPRIVLNCQGRFLKIRVNLCNVCPGRCINVGVLVCETFDSTDYIQGFKVAKVQVPGTLGDPCTEITVNDFCFVFSEPPSNTCPAANCPTLPPTCSSTSCPGICNSRTFKVKIIAHYSSFPSFQFCPC